MNENPPTIRLPDLQIRFDRIRRGEPLDDTIGRGRALLTLPPDELDETDPPDDQLRAEQVAGDEAPSAV
jgi:hypothetical protein